MEYIKIDKNTVIGYDLEKRTCQMFNPSDLSQEKVLAEAKLATIPAEPTEKQLLDWAKVNYPTVDYSVERQTLQDKITLATEVLAVK